MASGRRTSTRSKRDQLLRLPGCRFLGHVEAWHARCIAQQPAGHNGHDWAKRHADAAGIGCTALANGFATCEDPDALADIRERFGPVQVQEFFDRWSTQIPALYTED